MRRPSPLPALLVALLSTPLPVAAVLAAAGGCSRPAGASDAKVYSAQGTIKSFGPDRKYVSIAHDAIPGYMEAMTMTFEPDGPTRLASVAAGDRVSFSFHEADGGRRVLTAIEKLP